MKIKEHRSSGREEADRFVIFMLNVATLIHRWLKCSYHRTRRLTCCCIYRSWRLQEATTSREILHPVSSCTGRLAHTYKIHINILVWVCHRQNRPTGWLVLRHSRLKMTHKHGVLMYWITFVPGHAKVRHFHHQRVVHQTVSGSLQRKRRRREGRNMNGGGQW